MKEFLIFDLRFLICALKTVLLQIENQKSAIKNL